MKRWEELSEDVRATGKQLGNWATQKAQELGTAGMQQVEQYDLRTERKALVRQAGEVMVRRLVDEEKKTIRRDSPEITEILDRVVQIDRRLAELGSTAAD